MIDEKKVLEIWGTVDVPMLLEKFSGIGLCPNLLNDDNGKWLVDCGGLIDMGCTNRQFHSEVIINDPVWHKSVKEAVWRFALMKDTLTAKLLSEQVADMFINGDKGSKA